MKTPSFYFLVLFCRSIFLSKSSTINDESNRRRIASEEEALEIRRVRIVCTVEYSDSIMIHSLVDFHFLITLLCFNCLAQKLLAINTAAIPEIEDTASNVLIDPVMGPWPQCVGMQADDCVELIESLAADIYTVVVLPVETERTRVKIMADYDQKVIRVPHRG